MVLLPRPLPYLQAFGPRGRVEPESPLQQLPTGFQLSGQASPVSPLRPRRRSTLLLPRYPGPWEHSHGSHFRRVRATFVYEHPGREEDGNAAMDAPVGPSHRVAVAAGLLAEEGAVVQCVIVDFSATAALRFSPMIGGLEPGTFGGFRPGFTRLEPSAQTPQERVAFYSAEEEAAASPATVRQELQMGLQVPSSHSHRQGRKGYEALTSSLPTTAARLEDVVSRQTAMEAKLAAGPTAPLAEPLG